MKKFIMFTLLIAIMALSFGCSAAKPTDLSGEWKSCQNDYVLEDYTVEMKIEDNNAVVYLVSAEQNVKFLCWYGSYEAPKDEVTEYSWVSVNDTNMTKNSIFASDINEATFKYENGQISFDYSVFGMCFTLHFERPTCEEAA